MRVLKKAANGQKSHAPIVFSMATLAQFGQNIFMYSPGYLIIMKEAANNDNNAMKVINHIIISIILIPVVVQLVFFSETVMFPGDTV